MDLFGNEDQPQGSRAASLFDQIDHQEQAIGSLRDAWQRGRMPHALLLWGPPGVGKLRAALALGQLLLCRAAAARSAPCAGCPACQRVVRFTHPDLQLVLPQARASGAATDHKALEAYGQDPYHCLKIAPNAVIGIERIRELKSEAAKARVERGNRVMIIREAERMTPEAAQAALKLIEEPQAGTYLVLTCRDPQQLLPTILSRCRQLRFRPLPEDYIEQVLFERLAGGGDAAQTDRVRPHMMAVLARGSLGSALAMFEEDILGAREWARRFFGARLGSPQEAAARVHDLGRTWNLGRAQQAVDLQLMWFEDLLVTSQGLPERQVNNQDCLPALREEARGISLGEIKRRIGILEDYLHALKQNVNLTVATETMLLRLGGWVAGGEPF